MATYFNSFPKTPYILEKNGELSLVTNIITRVKFLDKIKNIISSYFTYDITEGETPESLAYKFYGSPYRNWIILLFNDIIDPQYDWYLNNNQLSKYIDKKYEALGGLSYAMNINNVKGYFVKETRTVNFPGDPKTTENVRETDATTWASVIAPTSITVTVPNYSPSVTATFTTSKYTQTYFDYEVEQNEKRKSIKIIKKEFIDQIEMELKNLSKMKIKSSI